MARTLYDKLWDSHAVATGNDGNALIYIDLHLVHEVTSPQAFDGLRAAGRQVRAPHRTLAVADHNVPTTPDRLKFIRDPEGRRQLEALAANCREFDVPYIEIDDARQGIVHVVGPELGATQPGMTIVCGDSHTSTHGAFGALAFGIGTSEVEHVLATQTLALKKSGNMRISSHAPLPPHVTAKDLVLAVIAKIGTAGATGHVVEYHGETFQGLSMEGRMTVCNMSIEAGARAGLMAPDDVTFDYLRDRPLGPTAEHWEAATAGWGMFASDPDAVFDRDITLDAEALSPQVTWGTSPEDSTSITGRVPDPHQYSDPAKREAVRKSLDYMGLKSGTPLTDITIDKVFIGSCTNGRIEDLRAAAGILKGKRVAKGVDVLVVPGSGLVKRQAEREGLDAVFTNAGALWREPGCSMCLGMNPDTLKPGERCASTSNRNFVGRQGVGGRTHLVSPAMAAAAAIAGRFVDVRTLG